MGFLNIPDYRLSLKGLQLATQSLAGLAFRPGMKQNYMCQAKVARTSLATTTGVSSTPPPPQLNFVTILHISQKGYIIKKCKELHIWSTVRSQTIGTG